MASGLVTIIYPVKDLAAAKQLFAKAFGVPPYIDEAYYVASTSAARTLVSTPTATARA
jgi:hypothetical protein